MSDVTDPLGGIERTLGRIEVKVDGVSDKVGSHAVELGQLTVRVTQTEKEIVDLHRHLSDDTGTKRQGHQLITASLVSASASAVLTFLVTLLLNHH